MGKMQNEPNVETRGDDRPAVEKEGLREDSRYWTTRMSSWVLAVVMAKATGFAVGFESRSLVYGAIAGGLTLWLGLTLAGLANAMLDAVDLRWRGRR
jgi:hypothetical protein